MGEIIDKTKGRIKQAIGSLTGHEDLKREGQNDERKGAVKGALADVKQAIKKATKQQSRFQRKQPAAPSFTAPEPPAPPPWGVPAGRAPQPKELS